MRKRKHSTEKLLCPKCGERLSEVYFLWSLSQAWEIERDESGRVISTRSKWTGTTGPDYALLSCSCELTEKEGKRQMQALLNALQSCER